MHAIAFSQEYRKKWKFLNIVLSGDKISLEINLNDSDDSKRESWC